MTTLAELRQANLREQKEQASRTPPEEPTPASPPAATPVASASPRPDGVVPSSVPTPSNAPTLVMVAAEESGPAMPDLSPEAVKGERFFLHVHESLSHKMTYPAGAKVSADMAPALFHRAKRYCLDHGNITLRQVLLDLLTVYLEEEGY